MAPVDLHEQLLAKAVFSASSGHEACALRHELIDGCLYLRVRGTTTSTFPDQFTDAVSELFKAVRPPFAAVDLSACTNLPSVMLAFLVFFQKNAEENGARKVALFGVTPRIQTMIKMIGMAEFFSLVPDQAAVQELMRRCGPGPGKV